MQFVECRNAALVILWLVVFSHLVGGIDSEGHVGLQVLASRDCQISQCGCEIADTIARANHSQMVRALILDA